jgi:phosphopantetheinyl transferase (holo-ACP synthase)
VIAVVRIARARELLDLADRAIVGMILSPAERRLYGSAATAKRRTEFIAGRLAAKCASATVRELRASRLLPLSCAEVQRLPGQGARCIWGDSQVHSVSITHSGPFAAAVASTEGRELGLDLEHSSRLLPVGLEGLFHPVERRQIASATDARICWVLREAWGKATGQGVFGSMARVATVRVLGRKWLTVPRGTGQSATMAAGENGLFALAISLRIERREQRSGASAGSQRSLVTLSDGGSSL